MMLKVHIAGMTMDPSSNTPIIILKSDKDERTLPIWIGLLEATSIASALQGIEFERPMTHDLFKNFMEMLNHRVTRVEVCELKDSTFFAKIHFVSGDRMFTMDARPSDAIAIALRFKAPMYVDETVIDQTMKSEQQPGEAVDKSAEGQKWAEYLESLSPEDFGKV